MLTIHRRLSRPSLGLPQSCPVAASSRWSPAPIRDGPALRFDRRRSTHRPRRPAESLADRCEGCLDPTLFPILSDCPAPRVHSPWQSSTFHGRRNYLAEKIGLHGAQAMDTIEKVNLSWQIPRRSASQRPAAVGPAWTTQGACIARAIENRLTRPIKKCWSDQALRSSVNVVTSNRIVVSNIHRIRGKSELFSILNV